MGVLVHAGHTIANSIAGAKIRNIRNLKVESQSVLVVCCPWVTEGAEIQDDLFILMKANERKIRPFRQKTRAKNDGRSLNLL